MKVTKNYLFKLTSTDIKSYNPISITEKVEISTDDILKTNKKNTKMSNDRSVLPELERYKNKVLSFDGRDMIAYKELEQEYKYLQTKLYKLDYKIEFDKQFLKIVSKRVEMLTIPKNCVDEFISFRYALSRFNRYSVKNELFDGLDEKVYEELKQENSNLRIEFHKLAMAFIDLMDHNYVNTYTNANILFNMCHIFGDVLLRQFFQTVDKWYSEKG